VELYSRFGRKAKTVYSICAGRAKWRGL